MGVGARGFEVGSHDVGVCSARHGPRGTRRGAWGTTRYAARGTLHGAQICHAWALSLVASARLRQIWHNARAGGTRGARAGACEGALDDMGLRSGS